MTSNKFVVHPGTGTVLRADECETVTVPDDMLALLTGDDYFDDSTIVEYATRYRAGNPTDARVCLCGNRPDTDGFVPCLPNGEEIEPTVGSAWDGHYRCERCHLVYGQGAE